MPLRISSEEKTGQSSSREFARDAGLAGTDPAHHNQKQGLGPSDCVTQRETEMTGSAAGVFFRRILRPGLNAFDFAAHHGAVAFVEVREFKNSRIAKFVRRSSQKQIGQGREGLREGVILRRFLSATEALEKFLKKRT
jgi:hypothetical protein